MTKKSRDKTVGLQLTQDERNLLQDLFDLDEELEEQIRQGPISEPIRLTLDELDELGEGIAAEIGNTRSSRGRDTLRALADKIEGLVTRCEGQKPSAANSETRIISLPDLSLSPLKVETAAMDFLDAFVDEIEEMCGGSPIDIDRFLDTLKPTRIEPDDKIGLRLTKSQRQLVLEIPELSESIAACVRDTPASRQKVEMTLGQISELENTIARVIQETTDRKTHRQLRLIDSELVNMQVKYTVHDDTTPLGPQLLASPSEVSRGALIRKLLTEMLEARRQRGGPKRGRKGSAGRSSPSRG